MTAARLAAVWAGALIVTLVSVAVGLATGPSSASFAQLLADLLDPAAQGHDIAHAILIDVRLLRVGGSFAVGASLSLAGVLLQAATRNPIADPYLIGTSAGATLAAVGLSTLAATFGGALPGVVSAFVLAWIDWLQPAAAFVGAMGSVSLALWLARVGGPASPVRILLAGLVLTAFGGAATSFLLYQASDLQLRAATGWLMGGVVASSGWQLLPAALVLTVSLAWGMARAVHLNALGLGQEAARGVGVDNAAMLRWAVWLSSALAGVAVALAGIIGFVGLLVPHGLRALVGRDHRALVPASALVGGAFLVLADAIARVIVAPAELPVGILTALAGCPLLLAFLRDRQTSTGTAVGRKPSAGHEISAAQDLQTAAAAGSAQILACRALSVTYPGAEAPALEATTLGYSGGQLVALVGPNGSGKSTLLRAFAGAIGYAGTVVDLGSTRTASTAIDPKHLAWLPQRLYFESGSTIHELVALGRTAYLAATPAGRLLGQTSEVDETAIADAIDRVGLPGRHDAQLDTLSGGQLQRAFLAMIFAQQARVMLLDEPTTALDLPGAATLLDQLKTWAQTHDGLAIIAIHDLPLALARADLVTVLSEGRCIGTAAPHSDELAIALRQAFGDGIEEFL